MNDRQPPRFYFALPRLLASLRGGDSRRTEMNAVEAWAASIAIFLISYLFFAGFIPESFDWWFAAPAFVAMAFVAWLFWLAILYLNSLILKLVRVLGFFRDLPQRRGQGALVATITTVMALRLLGTGWLSAEIASIWFTAVAMNLIAAMILAFRNGDRAHS